MRKIFLFGKLGQGKIVLVDNDNFNRLNQYHWFLGKEGYVKRIAYVGNGKRKSIYMHRLIMGIEKGFYGDHINHDKLDNRKENLRIVTAQQSVMNRNKQSNNLSGYKGVRKMKHLIVKPWEAQIRFNRKSIYIGIYATKEEAALAYNQKAQKLFGEFARLNEI